MTCCAYLQFTKNYSSLPEKSANHWHLVTREDHQVWYLSLRTAQVIIANVLSYGESFTEARDSARLARILANALFFEGNLSHSV